MSTCHGMQMRQMRKVLLIQEPLMMSLERFCDLNVRRGQPDFRKRLLKVYGGRCAISGCDCEDALEAAHIRRYGGEDTNHIQNGLLLRCDLHTLFDIGKLGIDPDTYRIVVADALLETVYSRLKGKKLRLPVNLKHHPNTNVLREHLNTWELIG